jgi:hypothetical protein
VNDRVLVSILVILIIQLFVLFSYEAKLRGIEKKMDTYFAPIEDIPLPEWDKHHGNVR